MLSFGVVCFAAFDNQNNFHRTWRRTEHRIICSFIACVYRFDGSSSSSRCEWETTDPPLENYWTDFCKRKLIEDKTLYLFLMTKTAFFQEHRRSGFLVCLPILLLLIWIGFLKEQNVVTLKRLMKQLTEVRIDQRGRILAQQ